MAKLADASALGADGATLGGSSPLPPNFWSEEDLNGANGFIVLSNFSAGVTQRLECHLAKVDVEGSNPFSRSSFLSKQAHLLCCSLVRLCDAIPIASPRLLGCAAYLGPLRQKENDLNDY